MTGTVIFQGQILNIIKGPVNCFIFTRIYPIYLLSSGVYIVADSIRSLIH